MSLADNATSYPPTSSFSRLITNHFESLIDPQSKQPNDMNKTTFDKPLIMTITGDVGSGKSVLADALVQRFDADRYSTGTVQRKLAEDMGITTLELNKRAETDPSIDEKIDSVFKSLEDTPVNLIVDSRMAWNFLPQSFKLKLEVNPLASAQRVWMTSLSNS